MSSDERTLRRITLALILVGLALRLALSAISWGSNDARLWELYAGRLDAHGLAALYHHQTQPLFNHPPLSAGLAWVAKRLADLGLWWPFAWRLPQILAELGVCLLLAWRWRDAAPRVRLGVVAVAALNPCGILISAHHGNTDALCAALALGALCLLEERSSLRARVGAGVVLGLALNVKLIPVLLVPVGFARCRSWAEARAFALGLAGGALPYALGLALAGGDFVRNVFGYVPLPDAWGIPGLIRVSGLSPAAEAQALGLYAPVGRYAVLLAGGAAAAFGAWRRWETREGYRVGAWSLVAFLVLSPGFGVQYLIYASPVLLAYRPRVGAAYALAAGSFAAVVYLGFVVRWFPLASSHSSRLGPGATLCGLVLWTGLAAWLARDVRAALRAPASAE